GAILILGGGDPVELKPVLLSRHLQEGGEPVGRVLREAVLDPARVGPWEAVEDDVRVALAGLGHEPELVAARLRARELVARQDVAGLAAAGGVLAAADLDLEVLEARAELGGEKE